MIDPDFLSVTELAARWGATPRQILEHGAHLRLPIHFAFSGLAFAQADRWLMGHGVANEERELADKKSLAARWTEDLKRNPTVLSSEFSHLNADEVANLRGRIKLYEERIEAIETLLRHRDHQRKASEYFGYMRLPPRAIQEISAKGEISFPHLAYHPLSQFQLITVGGNPYLDGELMTLEPGLSGTWQDKLKVDDLLIPFPAIKQLEAPTPEPGGQATTKRISRSEEQERAILAALGDLGYDPRALPPRQPGKPWVKSKIWKTLKGRADLFTQKPFNSAWDRLRGTGEIAEEDE